jgi:hypothetical protein
MASTAKDNFILSLSKDEAAALAAVKTDRIGQEGCCNRSIHGLDGGEGLQVRFLSMHYGATAASAAAPALALRVWVL